VSSGSSRLEAVSDQQRPKKKRKRDERRKEERKCLKVLLLLSNVVNVEKGGRSREKQRYYGESSQLFYGPWQAFLISTFVRRRVSFSVFVLLEVMQFPGWQRIFL
jgi:hypothetical protein